MSYFDDNDDSPAVVLWRERVDSYMDGQESVDALRRRIQPNPPWPEADNPMLGYLIARAMEIHEEHCRPSHDQGSRGRVRCLAGPTRRVGSRNAVVPTAASAVDISDGAVSEAAAPAQRLFNATRADAGARPRSRCRRRARRSSC